MKKIAVVLLSALVWSHGLYGQAGPLTVNPVVSLNGPRVSAYIRTWALGSTQEEFDRGVYWTFDQIKAEYLTDIILAFGLIDQQDKSSIYLPDLYDSESKLRHGATVPGFKSLWREVVKLKARYPHLKVNLSVGGYLAEFSDTMHDPALRAKFISAVLISLGVHDLDGIDIDWEYPVGPDWGSEIKARPEDRQNYLALLSELRTALDGLGAQTGKRYSLSTAVPASGWFVQKNDVVAAAQLVDSLKLMAYDYYGSWSGQTGHCANLSNNPNDPDWGGWSTKQALDAYLNAGVPPGKLMIGIPFYGRAWNGVEDGGVNGLYQKYKESAFPDGLPWSKIKEFLKEGSGYTRYWDNRAQAPFLYNGDTFITYTDAEAIRLITAYGKEKGLGGVFTWEYAHDIHADLLSVMATSAQ
ncbi:MAG: glycoside hydrolase family 18 protein [Treponema sp.]|jgi:chitinase|nr:glycoside hydrolase family 18 protein [Treponema sp.]